jgi:hypothetical protein
MIIVSSYDVRTVSRHSVLGNSRAVNMQTTSGVSILAPIPQQYADVLSLPAQEFLATLQR